MPIDEEKKHDSPTGRSDREPARQWIRGPGAEHTTFEPDGFEALNIDYNALELRVAAQLDGLAVGESIHDAIERNLVLIDASSAGIDPLTLAKITDLGRMLVVREGEPKYDTVVIEQPRFEPLHRIEMKHTARMLDVPPPVPVPHANRHQRRAHAARSKKR